jgi:hypothetical protein
MSKLWQYYKKHEQGVNFGLAIFGLVFGLVAYFFPFNSKPELNFYTQSKTNVIDINRPIENLRVLYKEKHINILQLITIRVQNDGSKDIEENSYSSQENFGLTFPNAEIVAAYLVNNNDDNYIKTNVKFKIIDSTQLVLNKIILESGKFYEFEILLICKTPKIAKIITNGKITGQDKITVDFYPYISEYDAAKRGLNNYFEYEKSKWEYWVIIAILVVCFYTYVFISYLKERKRKKALMKMKNKHATIILGKPNAASKNKLFLFLVLS